MFECANEINKLKNTNAEQAAKTASDLLQIAKPLGILNQDPNEYFRSTAGINDTINSVDVDRKVALRLQAKADKNWSLADQIRDELKEQGVIVEDSGQETTWRRQ